MNEKQALITGVLSGIGASLCCVIPLLFVSMGLGGAWLSHLMVLEPLRPLFIAISLACVGFAFYKLYITSRECKPGMACADNRILNKQRIIYWLATIALLGLISFPWFAPLLY